ncbi:MAG TPA: transporter [Burkholderiaceae bacterium]|nr:transporter [Burkholderiaceae bacterium]
MRRALVALMLFTVDAAAFADDVPPPDKGAYTLFNPTPVPEMRAFSTDRPPKANSPYTVDAGHFQYETDLAVFGHGNNDGIRTQSWTVFDPTLKLGLTNTIDAELQVTPYESVATTSAGSTTTIAGVGDTFARVKVNLLGDDGGDVAAALIPYLKLPTARSGLGNDKVEGGLIVPISMNAPAGFTVIVMPEGDYLKDANDSGYHAVFDFLVNVSHPLSDRWTVYTEVFTSQPFDGSDKPSYSLDGAFTFTPVANLQLDFGSNYSLNGVGPRIQLYVGLSQRF